MIFPFQGTASPLRCAPSAIPVTGAHLALLNSLEALFSSVVEKQ